MIKLLVFLPHSNRPLSHLPLHSDLLEVETRLLLLLGLLSREDLGYKLIWRAIIHQFQLSLYLTLLFQ
jgi:hypothetical protein